MAEQDWEGDLEKIGDGDDTQLFFVEERISIKIKGKLRAYLMDKITNPQTNIKYYYARKQGFKTGNCYDPPEDNYEWNEIRTHMQIFKTKQKHRKLKGHNTLKRDPANTGKSSRFQYDNIQKEKQFECKYKMIGCPAIKWVSVGQFVNFLDIFIPKGEKWKLYFVLYESDHNHVILDKTPENLSGNDADVRVQVTSISNESHEDNDNSGRCDSIKSNQGENPEDGNNIGNEWLPSDNDSVDTDDMIHNDDDSRPKIDQNNESSQGRQSIFTTNKVATSNNESLDLQYGQDYDFDMPSDDNNSSDKEDDPKDIVDEEGYEELDQTVEMEEKSTCIKTFKIKQSIEVIKAKARPKKQKEFEVSIKKSPYGGNGLYFEGDTPITKGTYLGPYTGNKFTLEQFEERNTLMGYGKADTPYAVHVREGQGNRKHLVYDPGNIFHPEEHPLAMINMANDFKDVNVMFKQYKEQMFLRVTNDIKKGSEFLTVYGGNYGLQLGIDMFKYYPKGSGYDHSVRKA